MASSFLKSALLMRDDSKAEPAASIVVNELLKLASLKKLRRSKFSKE